MKFTVININAFVMNELTQLQIIIKIFIIPTSKSRKLQSKLENTRTLCLVFGVPIVICELFNKKYCRVSKRFLLDSVKQMWAATSRNKFWKGWQYFKSDGHCRLMLNYISCSFIALIYWVLSKKPIPTFSLTICHKFF